jgi:hypothetical protein
MNRKFPEPDKLSINPYSGFRITNQPIRTPDTPFWFLVDRDRDKTTGRLSSTDLLNYFKLSFGANSEDTNTSYTNSLINDDYGVVLRLTGSDSTIDDVTLLAGTNIDIVVDELNQTATISSSNGISEPVDDISFEFRDINPTTSQTYILDIKASYTYNITNAILQSDDVLNNVTIKINNVAIGGLTTNVTTAISDTLSTSGYSVALGDQVTIATEITTSVATLIRGKLKINRTI